MSALSVFDIAGSGMNAQSLRLNLVASNIANANSVSSSLDEVYKSRQPVFAAQLSNVMDKNSAAVGVDVKGVVESQAPGIMEYAPNHPMADDAGYIFKPNVNTVEEMANMMSASRSYQNNVEVFNTSKQLMVNHSAGQYVDGTAHTNGIESVWALLKRGYNGVFHHFSDKHIGRYVDEFVFRLNDDNVKRLTLDRIDSIVFGFSGNRLSYKMLVLT